MKKNKGFTLIELLVVIAIIGILASVVLASLSNARDKGKDAAVKSQLASMKAQAELFLSSNEETGYEGVCNTVLANNINGLLVAATASSATVTSQTPNIAGDAAADALLGVCNDDASYWAVSVPLSTAGKFYCSDNTGVSKEVSTGIAAATVCPAA